MDFALFKIVIAGVLTVEILSLISFLFPPLMPAVFFTIVILTLILTVKKLEYGLYLLLTELFIGGKGYLFFLNLLGFNLSIRIAVFTVILIVWLAKIIKTRQIKLTESIADKKILIAYLILFSTIAVGLINGLINNQPRNVFFDFNAWIFFALLPVFLTELKNFKKTITVMVGTTSYLGLKTIATLILFSHSLVNISDGFYRWIRDSGVGEITYVSGSIFRIFFQSQIFILIGFLVVMAVVINLPKPSKHQLFLAGLYLYLTSLAIVISQSRSYWLGALVGVLGLLFISIWRLKLKIKTAIFAATLLIIMIATQIFLIQIITGNFAGNVVASRFKNLTQEAAGQSRLNQLEPLTSNIFQKVIFGYGFGKTLTYQSSDPRILQNYPNGIYTTYAFEWGYLDTWLKIGLFGLSAYLVVLIFITAKTLIAPSPLNIGLLSGIIGLAVTNMFSPYLNHPLGIGYLMLTTALIYQPPSMFDKIKKYVNQAFAQSTYNKELSHFYRTVDWVKKLKPDADEPILIAAYAHDIERAFRQQSTAEFFKDKNFTDQERLAKHSQQGAKIIEEFLLKNYYATTAISRIKNMIAHHEIGIDPESKLIQDADSISYLETNAIKHLKLIDQLGRQKVKQKIDWMYNRISSTKAKQFARPFYQKIIKNF